MKHKIISCQKFAVGLFLLFFLLWEPLTAFALEVPSLVETSRLGDNLKRADIRLIFIGDSTPEERNEFMERHIPGSLYLDRQLLKDIYSNDGNFLNKGKFETFMGSNLGISNETAVVLYDKEGGSISTTFVLWVMEYGGHRNIGILNGGITRWIKEKRKTDKALNVKPVRYEAALDGSIKADSDYVRKNLKNPGIVILDTRSSDEYTGKEKMGNRRGGHIPGAVNIAFHKANLNDAGSFKAVADLKAAYEAKGVTKDKEIIVYCQGGVRASHTYFVLKHLLGYPKVRVYLGSMGEWANKWNFIKYPMKKGS